MKTSKQKQAPAQATDYQLALAHKLASEAGHIALRQRASFECPRCGGCGSVASDGTALGDIFTTKCV